MPQVKQKKRCSVCQIDVHTKMKTLKTLLAEGAAKRTVVVAFGRMQPPTAGHALLVEKVIFEAKKRSATHIIYLSATNDVKKNPLDVNKKVYWARKSFPGANILGAGGHIRTFIEVVKEQNGRFDHLVIIAGSDRVGEYKNLLEKYNGKDYKFDTIEVVSAGERDPDADGAAGMSATKLRNAAVANDFTTFRRGVSPALTDADARKMMNDVRTGMGVKNPVNEMLSASKLRESFFNGTAFLVGQVVKENDQRYEIIDRGSNYVVVVNESGNTSRKFIDKLTIIDEEMCYDESTYKGVNLNRLESMRDHLDEVTDPVAMIRALNMLNSGNINTGKLKEYFENAGVSHYLTDVLENMSIVKSGDKLKVAKIIADTLGSDSSATSPDAMVNAAFRSIKNKPISRTTLPILQNMITLATEVGIKIDKSVLPAGIALSADIKEAKKADSIEVYTVDNEEDKNNDPDVNSHDLEMDALGKERLMLHLRKHMTLRHGNERESPRDSHKPGHSLDAKDLIRRMKARRLKGL